jgi:hypothetical protein
LTTVSSRPVGLTFMAALCFAASSCSSATRLPDGALLALEQQWESLAPEGVAELRISRVWPSQVPAKELTPWAPSRETWCVEVDLSNANARANLADATFWIVTRVDKDSLWSAAMLLTMSAIWPYQACELMP